MSTVNPFLPPVVEPGTVEPDAPDRVEAIRTELLDAIDQLRTEVLDEVEAIREQARIPRPFTPPAPTVDELVATRAAMAAHMAELDRIIEAGQQVVAAPRPAQGG